ncbi:type II toxin-antitoxin system Phd/YefM family antitoxin [Nocardiopsis exhalans]|uniref:Antitoxin n=1 Tax=Nocardiopsis exhalans TaxID=163604 RepID=A0ABY5D7G4_9ACTN|nr:type II toxin-antitoxin system Phd/YefM family antitoxin [Nocardiopsis exhalans]USY19046.1 type II toxin-antitoxin system Phd/YefM family antitoxin [Nocardiopsis exhalans]
MSDHSMNVRDARAHLSELITKAQNGDPTILTRNGTPAAAIVPIEDFEALEDAMDAYLARQADQEEDEGGPAVGMAEMVAEIFDESRGNAA